MVDFVINTQGKIDSIQILNSVHPLLDKEVIRILRIKSASQWLAASYGDKAISIHYWFPFVFSLDKLSPLEQLASDMTIGPNYEPPLFNNVSYNYFYDFIDANIIDINPDETELKIVIISFILDRFGKIKNIKNLGTIGNNVELDEIEEAMRVVSLSEGYWTPAQNNDGRTIPIQITVPVRLYDKTRYEE
jgi:hypothetical protein